MRDLKLDKITSPRLDKGNGFTDVKLKPDTRLPEAKKSMKTVDNAKKGWKVN
jgi:hypothetical protein|tara:strand:- start:1425 stop:1580 length:156 start_codon:yes stop_codon:yes gene_type:complete